MILQLLNNTVSEYQYYIIALCCLLLVYIPVYFIREIRPINMNEYSDSEEEQHISTSTRVIHQTLPDIPMTKEDIELLIHYLEELKEINRDNHPRLMTEQNVNRSDQSGLPSVNCMAAWIALQMHIVKVHRPSQTLPQPTTSQYSSLVTQ
jgi:hypothetical protein